MSDTLFLGGFGIVLIAFGVWIYRSASAERFYKERPYLLAATGWIFTGIIPVGIGALLVGIGSLFPNGSLAGQIPTGAGFIAWLMGFGLVLIHPDRVRPKWLRGKIGD